MIDLHLVFYLDNDIAYSLSGTNSLGYEVNRLLPWMCIYYMSLRTKGKLLPFYDINTLQTKVLIDHLISFFIIYSIILIETNY